MKRFLVKLLFVGVLLAWFGVAQLQQFRAWFAWKNPYGVFVGAEKTSPPPNEPLGEIYSGLRSLDGERILTFQQSEVGYYGGAKWVRHIDPSLMDLYELDSGEAVKDYLLERGIHYLVVPHHQPVTIRKSAVGALIEDPTLTAVVAGAGGWRVFSIHPLGYRIESYPIPRGRFEEEEGEKEEGEETGKLAFLRAIKAEGARFFESSDQWLREVSAKISVPDIVEDPFLKAYDRVKAIFEGVGEVHLVGEHHQGVLVEGNMEGPEWARVFLTVYDDSLAPISKQVIWEGPSESRQYRFSGQGYIPEGGRYLTISPQGNGGNFTKSEFEVFAIGRKF